MSDTDATVFPALAAVELDDLLTELRERAVAVRSTQERLRALLGAVVAVSADLDLPMVLERIVSTACELVGARYGALGVLDSHRPGRLSEFITYGVDEEQKRRIGALPTGHGLLGLLIQDPHPLREADISRHPASHGFPANHPPMHTFLGVPLRVGRAVFGNLYLSEKAAGEEFTAEDEEVVVALAAAAGVAVEKARIYEQTRRQGLWLAAAEEITNALLSEGRRGDSLALVASRAREVADADVGVLLLAEDADLVVEIVDWRGRLLDGDQPVRPGDPVPKRGPLRTVLAGGPPTLAATGAWPELGQNELIIAPMRAAGSTAGLLVLGRATARLPFSRTEDLPLAAGFAEQAALALELARAQTDRARLAVLEDRDRIARDLHDVVVQRLFAVGLSLRFTGRAALSEEDRNARIASAIEDLDVTVKDIRRSIFRLHSRSGEGDLGADVESVLAAAQPLLGFSPRLTVVGSTVGVPHVIGSSLLPVLREALSNIARHAEASHVEVTLGVSDRVELTVADDGRGMADSTRRSGLANMQERAQLLGGRCRVESGPVRGTVVRWSVPMPVDGTN